LWIFELWISFVSFHLWVFIWVFICELSFVNVYSSMNQSLMNQARSCAEHVITGQLTEPWTGPLLVDLPSLTSFRKSYLFHPLNLGAGSLHLIEWNRIHTVERWIDTDQSLLT
jgi:hypothetical protein